MAGRRPGKEWSCHKYTNCFQADQNGENEVTILMLISNWRTAHDKARICYTKWKENKPGSLTAYTHILHEQLLNQCFDTNSGSILGPIIVINPNDEKVWITVAVWQWHNIQMTHFKRSVGNPCVRHTAPPHPVHTGPARLVSLQCSHISRIIHILTPLPPYSLLWS